MKAKSFLMTGVVCAAAIGCFDVSGGTSSPQLGVRAAEAKDYYTRKRIDGKWVTGIFPKKGTKLEAEFEAKAAAARQAEAEPKGPTLFGLNIPGVDLAYRPPMSAKAQQPQEPEQTAAVEPAAYENASYMGTTTAKASRLIEGTPGVQDRDSAEPARDQKRVRAAQTSQPQREKMASAKPRASAAARQRADQEFAAAVTQPNQAAEPPVLPASVQAYAPAPERNDLLTALQRKARAIAAEEAIRATGSITPVASMSGAAEPPQPTAPARWARAAKAIRSVTLDYQNGIRTTIFQDGSIEEEAVVPRP